MSDVVKALAALCDLTDVQRERWVDHRIVGMSLRKIAERDGVKQMAVWTSVTTADAKLALWQARAVA